MDCKAEDGKGEKPAQGPGRKGKKPTAPEDKSDPLPPVPSLLPSEVPTPWACDAVTVGNPEVKIVIAIGQRVFLINVGDTQASLKKGTVVGGYLLQGPVLEQEG